MNFDELVKALGLDVEKDEDKEKVAKLKKEYNAKEKAINELTEENNKLKEDAIASKEIADKFNIVVKAFEIDTNAEDFDKHLDDIKDNFIKQGGEGAPTPEEVKILKRDLTKAQRELEKANSSVTELTTQLEAEKTQRINSIKRDAIQKALIANNVVKPDQFISNFFDKVTVDDDGKTLTMKDSAGNEISVSDGVADWAKENPEFVKIDTNGGFGSNGGKGGSNNDDGVSEFMKSMIESQSGGNSGGNGNLVGFRLIFIKT